MAEKAALARTHRYYLVPIKIQSLAGATVISWLWSGLKYSCLITLLALPCMVLYGALFPWPAADAALRNRTDTKILVGVSYQSRLNGTASYSRKAHTYAVFPTSLKTFTVIKENSSVHTDETPFGLVYVLVMYLVAAAGTWWFWLRPDKQDRRAH